MGKDYDMQNLLKRIDEYKKLIDTKRPLKPEEVKELDDYFRIGTTYSSNAIEGNTLTITETKVLLERMIICLKSQEATTFHSVRK